MKKKRTTPHKSQCRCETCRADRELTKAVLRARAITPTTPAERWIAGGLLPAPGEAAAERVGLYTFERIEALTKRVDALEKENARLNNLIITLTANHLKGKTR